MDPTKYFDSVLSENGWYLHSTYFANIVDENEANSSRDYFTDLFNGTTFEVRRFGVEITEVKKTKIGEGRKKIVTKWEQKKGKFSIWRNTPEAKRKNNGS